MYQNQNILLVIHQFTRAKACEDLSLDLTSDVNLATGSSELSVEDIMDAGMHFQLLMVSEKKLYLLNMSVLAYGT